MRTKEAMDSIGIEQEICDGECCWSLTWSNIIELLVKQGVEIKDSIKVYAQEHNDDKISIYGDYEIYLKHANEMRKLPLTGQGHGAWLSKRLCDILTTLNKQRYCGDYSIVDSKYHNTYYCDSLDNAKQKCTEITRAMMTPTEATIHLSIFRWNPEKEAYVDEYMGTDGNGNDRWYDDKCRLTARFSGL
jgi:hypothetical protein